MRLQEALSRLASVINTRKPYARRLNPGLRSWAAVRHQVTKGNTLNYFGLEVHAYILSISVRRELGLRDNTKFGIRCLITKSKASVQCAI